MRVIKIPYSRKTYPWLSNNEIEDYLTNCGLVKGKHYKIYNMTGPREFHVVFNEGYKFYESMLIMKYIK